MTHMRQARKGRRLAVGLPNLGRLVDERPSPDIFCDHKKVAVRVLHKDLFLTALAIAGPSPNFSWAEIDGPVTRSQLGQDRLQACEIDLKHSTLPKREDERPRFESSMPLTEHELMALGMLKVNELFVRPLEGRIETEDALPE